MCLRLPWENIIFFLKGNNRDFNLQTLAEQRSLRADKIIFICEPFAK